jgi:protein-S-isoprenylcysteine O-methyltransferase Ste14
MAMTVRMLIRFIVWLAALAVLLFGAAGTIRWPAGWVLLILMTGSGVAITSWLARHDLDLLAERMGSIWQKDQERWDKVVLTAFAALWAVWFVLMALDAGRWHPAQMPLWLQGIGVIGYLASMYFTWLTFRENSFAAPVVKIQTARKQHVITTGPYAIVRHPMYAAALLSFVATPLVLGSWLGLVFAPLLVIALAIRTVKEEATLTEKLEGYSDYAARVRYRFIPGIW